ncbi:hypothetical protein ACWEIJ_45810 [Lentzea sp. NPDC004789]
MKRLLVVVVCLFGAACGTSAPTTASSAPSTSQVVDDSQSIGVAFEAFRKAVVAKDGAAAASVLSSSTFSEYDKIRKVALTGAEQQVAVLVPSGRILAYTMRGDMDPVVLRSASPRDLVKAVIDEGLVSGDSVNGITLGDLTIHDGKALGKVAVPPAQTTVFLSFLREDGAWKFELPSMFDFTDARLGAAAKRKNLSHAQMIDEVLLAKYGPAKAAEVRKPIGA